MISCIYKIVGLNNKIYVGSSVNFKKRQNAHLLALRNNKHSSPKLQCYYNKHGISSLTFEVIEYVEDVSLLIEREQYYIDTLKPFFNCAQNAGSPLGVKHSDETKSKHSKNRIGKPIHNDEFKKALSERNKNRVWTDEMKLKISEKNKGTIISEETRKKISEAGKGRVFSDEHKKRIGYSKKGKAISEKTRKAVSLANSNRVWTKEMKEKISISLKLKNKNNGCSVS